MPVQIGWIMESFISSSMLVLDFFMGFLPIFLLLGLLILLVGVLSFLLTESSYGPREIADWAVEKGWAAGTTRFDVYEGTPFTKKEFDAIISKAESLGKLNGLKYLQNKINSRFYGFGVYR